MTQIIKPSRRNFILGLGALIAAPSIVKASSIMPVKVIKPEVGLFYIEMPMPPGEYRFMVVDSITGMTEEGIGFFSVGMEVTRDNGEKIKMVNHHFNR